MEPHHFLSWRLTEVCRRTHPGEIQTIPLKTILSDLMSRGRDGRYADDISIYAKKLGLMGQKDRKEFLTKNGHQVPEESDPQKLSIALCPSTPLNPKAQNSDFRQISPLTGSVPVDRLKRRGSPGVTSKDGTLTRQEPPKLAPSFLRPLNNLARGPSKSTSVSPAKSSSTANMPTPTTPDKGQRDREKQSPRIPPTLGSGSGEDFNNSFRVGKRTRDQQSPSPGAKESGRQRRKVTQASSPTPGLELFGRRW